VRGALDDAFLAGFRPLMLVCAGLTVTGPLLAGLFVERRDPEGQAAQSSTTRRAS
jgi:hypothetical protein